MSDLRYPIGPFQYPGPGTNEQRQRWIADVAETPARLRQAVAGLSSEQIETPYRPEGWTVRQVAHHVPDSHLNAFIRFKLALTEDQPTIKPYNEKLWAELADSSLDIGVSLTLLDAVHTRWLRILESMTPADFERKLTHPEIGLVTLDRMLALYSWHGQHHVAHVTSLRERMGW